MNKEELNKMILSSDQPEKELKDIPMDEEAKLLAEDWALFKDLGKDELPEISPSLDFIIKREASDQAEENKAGMQKRINFHWGAVAPIAASFIFACLIFMTQTNRQSSSDQSPGAELRQNPAVVSVTEISWDSVDLEDDLWGLNTQIEFNDVNIRVNGVNGETEESDETFAVEIPDLLT